jgi:ribulose 1,5-bisphosphate synthetase/thiazole synthase
MTSRAVGGPAVIAEPSRSTPVHGEFDVAVVGGGPAGIMAVRPLRQGATLDSPTL